MLYLAIVQSYVFRDNCLVEKTAWDISMLHAIHWLTILISSNQSNVPRLELDTNLCLNDKAAFI